MEKIIGAILVAILVLVVFSTVIPVFCLVSAFINLWVAYWVTYLWDWFIVPIGLPSLNMWVFFGATYILNLIHPVYPNISIEKDLDLTNDLIKIISRIIAPPLIVGVVYVFKFWNM